VPYNISIVLKGVDNLKPIANLISKLVENATGQSTTMQIHDKKKLSDKKRNELETINRKLLK